MKKDIQLIFDFDDTIVKTAIEFDRTNEETVLIVARAVYGELKNLKEIMMHQRKVDIGLIAQYGFVPTRYIESWVQTYEEIAKMEGISVSDAVKSEVIESVKRVYSRKYEELPGAIPVLSELKNEGYHMMILTAGIDTIQRRKIKEAGADIFMDDIQVRPNKTPDVFRSIMNDYPAHEYVMIGNSLKSDIYPALENDVWGFHIERYTWAADDHPIDQNHPKYVHMNSIHELPEKLKILQNKLSLSV